MPFLSSFIVFALIDIDRHSFYTVSTFVVFLTRADFSKILSEYFALNECQEESASITMTK